MIYCHVSPFLDSKARFRSLLFSGTKVSSTCFYFGKKKALYLSYSYRQTLYKWPCLSKGLKTSAGSIVTIRSFIQGFIHFVCLLCFETEVNYISNMCGKRVSSLFFWQMFFSLLLQLFLLLFSAFSPITPQLHDSFDILLTFSTSFSFDLVDVCNFIFLHSFS